MPTIEFIQEIHGLKIENERLKAENRELRNNYALVGAMIESIEYVLNGEEVSEFMESFGIVREVIDLKAEITRLRDMIIKGDVIAMAEIRKEGRNGGG